MGSSKKSGDRDKERDSDEERGRERSSRRERRRRERSRSRSRSRERRRDRSRSRERGRERRGRSRSREREKDRGRDSGRKDRDRDREKTRRHRGEERVRDEKSRSESEEETSSQQESEKRLRQKEQRSQRREERSRELDKDSSSNEEEGDGPLLKGSGEATALSVEETNKLRAKLGLKPLQVEGQGENKDGQEEAPSTAIEEDVHVPPKNIADIKAAEKLKDKMETLREKRRITSKLRSVRTLGEGEGESAAGWVERMRQLQKEKVKAEERERLLAEMDEEFGVGDLVNETLKEEKRHAYSSKDLTGLTVEHKTEHFREGREVVLTLKDTGILEEQEDVLVNVNIVDNEKAERNVELKKNKMYNPFEEEEDEFGDVKPPSLLKKYDEEIEGVKKKSFMLGTEGEVDTAKQRERDVIRERLKAREISLELAPSQIASEYFTTEEMVQFKKPGGRKKKKLRKKEKFKVDDLLVDTPAEGTKDHGSRGKSDPERDEDEPMDMGGEQLVSDAALKDEADTDVDSALMRTRRLLRRGKPETSGAAKVVGMLQSVVKQEPEEATTTEDAIILDATAEFWGQVGGEEVERVEVDESGMSLDTTAEPSRHMGEEEQETQREERWEEVMDTETTTPSTAAGEPPGEDPESKLYQEAEPLVRTGGVSAALKIAALKGFFEGEKNKSTSKSQKDHGERSRDREYERQREREREREFSRFTSDFPEKKGYVPNVRIEYVDDHGRILNTKEAFRYMSHKFHGRGSGRKKTERRIKKLQDEQFLKKSSSTDTPLNTLAMLQAKQKSSQAPYIMLSGGASSVLAPDISKK